MTTATRTATTSSISLRYIDQAIEACWLTAIATTVLLFHGRTLLFHFTEPKQNVLHWFALAVACLWVLEIALDRTQRERLARSQASWRIWRWAGKDGARWLLISVGIFSLAQILSAVLSPLPAISAFGRDLNDPGYELYSGLSYAVIFFAIALRVRHMDQVRRVLYVVAVSGTLASAYGVSQHFGWDPIGYAAGAGRVPSTMGNPIFLASFLIMSLYCAIAFFLIGNRRLFSWWTVAVCLSIGLHLSAIWFSGSRGPLVALFLGAVVAALSALLLLNRRVLIRGGLVACIGSLIALVVILLPAPESSAGRSGREIIASILGQAASATGAEVSLSTSNLATDSVGGRVDIWRGALELLKSRDSLERNGGFVKVVRHLFGYGQDMYYYSYPLTAQPRSQFILVSHAHNYPLHIWLELGVVGLLALAGIVVAAGVALVQVAQRLRGDVAVPHAGATAVLLVALVALMAGRATEQMAGVARVGDLTTFWAMLGLTASLGWLSKVQQPEPVVDRADRTRRQVDEFRPLWIGGAIGLFILAVTLWVSFDGVALYASHLAAKGNHEFNVGNDQAGYELTKRAADIDRFSEYYGLIAAQLERNSAESYTDRQARVEALLVPYRTLADFEETAPWAVNNDIRLTAVVASIAELGVPEARQELWNRTVDLDLRMGAYPEVMAFLANSYVALGEFDLGIEVAEYAIDSGRSVSLDVPQAWWSRGEALVRVDRIEDGLDSLMMAIEVAPDSRFAALSHRTLANFYEENGNAAEAERHRGLAEKIEQALTAGT